MIIKFLKSTEVNDRLYVAGQARDFPAEQAAELIASGDAVDASIEPAAEEAPAEKPVKKSKKA